MDSKRMAMLVVMMLVMGNILFEAEGMAFTDCYKGCFVMCAASSSGFKKLLCPFSCIKACKQPTPSSEANLNEIDQTDYFCKLGCATDRCASSSSIHDKGTEKEAKGKSILTEQKKKEREAAKMGKKPYYLKQSEIRKQELIEKYNSLKESGKLSSFRDKRRKKNATKDHRYMPYRRADVSEQ
ncbi:hypothetical protein DY000_02057803 [Brassica cretica]|uniref:rRNA biogenesis protein RRP36 n=1 Tax=Brassica cretica TaxID=69181 RepID=A0ABQ7ABT5_BRACR|nr:hypothetical protein DY000_02057803 [Brassica cretica]